MKRHPQPRGAGRLLLAEGTGCGFISQYTHALGLGLHRRGLDVQLATGRADELHGWPAPFAKHPVLGRGAATWWTLARMVSDRRPDWIHFQWISRPWIGLALVRHWQRRGIRVMYTPHNILPHCARFLCWAGYRAWYGAMDAVVARDHHMAWALEEVMEIPRHRIRLVPGSPTVLTEAPGAGAALPDLPARAPDETRLLFFGHGGPGKGLGDLAEALLGLPGTGAVHLVAAGECVLRGVDPELWRRLCGRLRVTVMDRYLPAEQVPVLFRACDLLVLPYRKVCASPLLDLAAALGLPVLRTNRVQAARFIEGRHGWTVPHGDAVALGATLAGLAADGGALAVAAAELAGEQRDRLLSRVADQHLQVYESVAGARKPAAVRVIAPLLGAEGGTA